MAEEVEVTWENEDPEKGTADLWVDGRVAEYDVPDEEREDALRRARVVE